MDTKKNESDAHERSSTLLYSTELNASTDFNFSPVQSPREVIEIPIKEGTIGDWIKKLCCCLCCCCDKKKEERLVLDYEYIQ